MVLVISAAQRARKVESMRKLIDYFHMLGRKPVVDIEPEYWKALAQYQKQTYGLYVIDDRMILDDIEIGMVNKPD